MNWKRSPRRRAGVAAAAGLALAAALLCPPLSAELTAEEAVRRALALSPELARAEQEVAVRAAVVEQARGLFDGALLADARVDYGVEELVGSRLKAEQDRRLRLEIPPPILDDIARQLMERLPTDASFFLPSSCLAATSFIVLGGTSTIVCVNDDGNVLGLLDSSATFDPSLPSAIALSQAFAGLDGIDERVQVFIDLLRNSAADQMRLAALILRRSADSLRMQRIRIGKLPEDRESIRLDAGIDYRVPFRNGMALVSSLSLASSEENFRGKRLDPTWGDSPIANQFNAGAGLALDVPLGRGAGRASFAAPLTAAEFDLAAAEALRDHAAATRALIVLEAYWDLAAASRRLELLTESLAVQDRLLAATVELADAGVVPRIDLELNRARRASVASSVAAARQSLHTARAQLAREIGLDAGDLATLEVDDDFDSWVTGDSLDTAGIDALVARATAERDDLQALENRLEADRALAVAAERNLRPDVSLSLRASYNAFYETFRERFYDVEGFEKAFGERWAGPSYGVTLRFRVPIGNNAARGRLLQARSAVASTEIEAADLARGVRLSVIESTEALRRAAAELESRRSATEYITQTADATLERFRAGNLTVLDTLLTESDLTNARLQELDSGRAWLSLAARLRFATGTLLETPAGDPGAARLAPLAAPIL